MLLAYALSIASRSRGFIDASAPPSRAATVISLISRVMILPRFASVAAFLCLMFAHLLWPAMVAPSSCYAKLYRRNEVTGSSDQALVAQELRERREADFAVVDLQHALLEGK